MQLPKVGEYVLIHSYKHNGTIHRSWEKGLVLSSDEDRTIVMNQHTLVNEADGRIWYTREPAICYFPHHEWYNVICMIRKNGVHYYCNMASPTLYDGEALKYIDYDLDLRVFSDGAFKVLDRNEYNYHSKLMHYPKEIDKILKSELSTLIEMEQTNEIPFDKKIIDKYYEDYLKIKHMKENQEQ